MKSAKCTTCEMVIPDYFIADTCEEHYCSEKCFVNRKEKRKK